MNNSNMLYTKLCNKYTNIFLIDNNNNNNFSKIKGHCKKIFSSCTPEILQNFIYLCQNISKGKKVNS